MTRCCRRYSVALPVTGCGANRTIETGADARRRRRTWAGAKVQKPLATVVIGGLISATLRTLFVLPTLTLILGISAEHRSPAARTL
ncbi:hypothetical protein D9601_18345 [Sphingomonas sp. MA1305]|nr:hypothetical protein [Sphingomonas sp. MA1305]